MRMSRLTDWSSCWLAPAWEAHVRPRSLGYGGRAFCGPMGFGQVRMVRTSLTRLGALVFR